MVLSYEAKRDIMATRIQKKMVLSADPYFSKWTQIVQDSKINFLNIAHIVRFLGILTDACQNVNKGRGDVCING